MHDILELIYDMLYGCNCMKCREYKIYMWLESID